MDLSSLPSISLSNLIVGDDGQLLSSLPSISLSNLIVGDDGQLLVPNLTSILQTDVLAQSGGQLDLPSLTNFSGGMEFDTVVATGANSVIDMSSLTSLAGGNGNHRNAGPFDVKFQALFGGKVDLSNLTAVTGRTQMRAHGTDSVMDLSSLPSISLGELIVGDNGRLLVPNLTSILQTDVLAQSGGQLDLPSLTNFSGGMEFDTVVATGANSIIDMSSLTSLAGGDGNHRNAGPFDVKFQALFGGKVDLSNLTAVTGRTQMRAHGAGSIMDLSSLTEIPGGELVVGEEGQLLVPNLTSIERTDLFVQSDGQLDLPSLTNFSGGMEFDTVIATGANSIIDMSSLTSLAGGDGNHRNAGPFDVKFQALFGGKVDLSNLTAVTGRTQMQAHGTDSVMDLSSLPSISLSKLIVGDDGQLLVPNLTSILQTDVLAQSGGQLDLPSLTNFSGGMEFDTVVATGANSVIDMSSLTSLAGGNGNHRNAGPFDVKFQALFGGKVDLSNLTAVTGRTQMQAHGTDSVMDLSSLPSISLSKLIVGDDGQLLVPNLTSILQTDVLAQSGGQLDLPSLTNFSGGMEFDTVVATGANSVIDMSSLTSLAGGNGNHRNAGPFDVKFQALDGGTINLSNVTSITEQTQFKARDGGGITLSSGNVTVDGTSSFTADTGTIAAGTFTLTEGSEASFAGTFDANLDSSGLTNIGNQVGVFHTLGNYDSAPTSTLGFQLGGAEQGVTFDHLDVEGSATLAGSLSVSLTFRLAPKFADRFEIITANTLTGSFSATSFPPLSSILDWKTKQTARRFELAVVGVDNIDSGINEVGTAGGGALSTGGVDVAFPNTTGGIFTVDYEPITQDVFFDRLSQGEFPFNDVNFFIPTDPFQLWNVSYSGSFDAPIELVFGYNDDSLVPGQSEDDLAIFHFENNQWVPLPGIVDTLNNTITVAVNSLSPFALGVAIALTPAEMIEELISEVHGLDIPVGLKGSLLVKLRNALSNLENGNTAAVAGLLRSFINQVEAQRGKKLTTHQADELAERSRAILSEIDIPASPLLVVSQPIAGLDISSVSTEGIGGERSSIVKIVWEGGTLQESHDLGDSWRDIPDAVSPYWLEAGSASRFFRLRSD